MTSASTNVFPLTLFIVAEALVNVKRTSLQQVQLRFVGAAGVLSLHHTALQQGMIGDTPQLHVTSTTFIVVWSGNEFLRGEMLHVKGFTQEQ